MTRPQAYQECERRTRAPNGDTVLILDSPARRLGPQPDGSRLACPLCHGTNLAAESGFTDASGLPIPRYACLACHVSGITPV